MGFDVKFLFSFSPQHKGIKGILKKLLVPIIRKIPVLGFLRQDTFQLIAIKKR